MDGNIEQRFTKQIDAGRFRQLRLQTGAMSFIVLFLFVCALATLSALPEICTLRPPGWQLKVVGTVLFNVLVGVGIVDNVLSYRAISQMKRQNDSDID